MSGLVEFLRARLDEDETAAKAAAGPRWRSEQDWADAPVYADGPTLVHIALHDPARVLAEVRAKRLLITLACEPAASIDGEVGCCHDAESLERGWRLQHFDDDGGYNDEGFPEPIPSGCYGVSIVNRLLAPLGAVYDAHPDYDEAWRP